MQKKRSKFQRYIVLINQNDRVFINMNRRNVDFDRLLHLCKN